MQRRSSVTPRPRLTDRSVRFLRDDRRMRRFALAADARLADLIPRLVERFVQPPRL